MTTGPAAALTFDDQGHALDVQCLAQKIVAGGNKKLFGTLVIWRQGLVERFGTQLVERLTERCVVRSGVTRNVAGNRAEIFHIDHDLSSMAKSDIAIGVGLAVPTTPG